MKKAILLTVLIIAAVQFSFAQNTIAKLKFEEAEEAYTNNNFELTLTKLKEVEVMLGSTNPKILYLQILAQAKVIDKNPLANYHIIESARTSINKYLKDYENLPDNEDKYREIYKISESFVKYPTKQDFDLAFEKAKPDILEEEKKMIKIEGGTFTMGDNTGDASPAHDVTLKNFSLAKTETTVLQWKRYCTATGRQMPETPFWGWIDAHPIVMVNYDEAVGYCDWLSYITGELYRLPTEAEWEYAARGGKQSKGYEYSGGQNIDMTGWCDANSNKQTQAVAQKRANDLGIYDMSGNVWEWCKDWYGPYTSAAQTNPIGTASGSIRVLRGGSWFNPATLCRVCRPQQLRARHPQYQHWFPGGAFPVNRGFPSPLIIIT